MTKPIIIISGGFDPLHCGHARMFGESALQGDIIVLLNSDNWLTRKKGRPFMSWSNRATILHSMKGVIDVLPIDDRDDTCIDGIKTVKQLYKNRNIIFVNGGDRINDNTPEVKYCEENNIALKFNVGGEKVNSSSNILAEWREPKTRRKWGHWSVLKEYANGNVKVKELVVYPGESLSYQKHNKRNEFWFVAEGEGEVYIDKMNELFEPEHRSLSGLNLGPKITKLKKYDTITLKVGDWHKLRAGNNHLLHVVEIQWGEECVEDDIERKPLPTKAMNIGMK